MKKWILTLFLFTLNIPAMAATNTNNLIVCKSEYALCTTAVCTPMPDKKGWVSCACDVKSGYSAGNKACQKEKPNNKGDKIIFSRYYPVSSYAICTNNRPWAWCLDSACTIDKADPTKASCACSLVQSKESYVVVDKSNQYSKASCTTGIISSAFVWQAEQINNFLKTQPNLKPAVKNIYKE